MLLKDVRIGLRDKSYLHFPQATITYLPNVEEPVLVNIQSSLFNLDFDYQVIEYIFPNWHDKDETTRLADEI